MAALKRVACPRKAVGIFGISCGSVLNFFVGDGQLGGHLGVFEFDFIQQRIKSGRGHLSGPGVLPADASIREFPEERA